MCVLFKNKSQRVETLVSVVGGTKNFFFSYFLNKCCEIMSGYFRRGWTWSKTLRMRMNYMPLSSLLHVHLCTPPQAASLSGYNCTPATSPPPPQYSSLLDKEHSDDGSGWNGFFLWLNGWKSSRQHGKALIWRMLSPSTGTVWPPSVHVWTDFPKLKSVASHHFAGFAFMCCCCLIYLFFFHCHCVSRLALTGPAQIDAVSGKEIIKN